MTNPGLSGSALRTNVRTAYPNEAKMELIGFEPTTSALQGRRSPN
jgi:hypothetical protein